MDEMNIDEFLEEVEHGMEALMLHWEDYFTEEHTTIDGDEYDGDDTVTTTLHDPAYKFTIELVRGYKNKGKDEHGEPIIDCIYEGIGIEHSDNGDSFKKWLQVNIPEVLENIALENGD